MAATEYPLTRSDFDASDWQTVIADAVPKDSFHYRMNFGRKLRDAQAAGNESLTAVFTVLCVVTDVELRADDSNQPFGPRFVYRASRGAEPSDVTDEQLSILRELAPTVADPEMRARLCDIVWTMNRDHQLAKMAVGAYLDSAKARENRDQWVPCVDRLTRAVSLARSLGRGGIAEFDKAIGQVEDLLSNIGTDDSGFQSCRLMELLQSVKAGDRAKYAERAEKLATRAEREFDFRRAKFYWECAADWFRLSEEPDKRHRALVAAAETHVKQADRVTSPPNPSHMLASTELREAIKRLRKIGGTAALERADSLYKQLVEHQRLSVSELQTFTHSADVTDIYQSAQQWVAGFPVDVALQRLAQLVKPTPKANLRSFVEREYTADPLVGLFASSAIGPTGKIVAVRPSFETSAAAKEAAITAEMFRNADMHRGLTAEGRLVAAIHKVRSESHVRFQDFLAIAASSDFVPPGRELTVAKGLYAGFNGDLIVSTHLLIPQVEESVRMHLSRRGAITSGFNRQNAQTEFDLNTTLYMPEIALLFDEDTVFDLRGLLVEQYGSNLRNLMAHGLMSDDHLQSRDCLYLWGLTLRLCVMFLPPPLPDTPEGVPAERDMGDGSEAG